MSVTKSIDIASEPFIKWLFEDRTLAEIQASMVQTRAYIKSLKDEVRRLKKRKKYTGSATAKSLLVRDNPKLSRKISLPEYHLGMALQALLTPANFEFFADKLKLEVPDGEDEQLSFMANHGKDANSHTLVLEIDSLGPLWKITRKRIMAYIQDYARMTEMDIEVPKAADQLAEVLRSLSSEVVKLYAEADPKAADAISRQAHRKILDFHSAGLQDDQGVSPQEVQIAHAFKALTKALKAKQVTQQEFVREIAVLSAKLPPEIRKQWARSTVVQKSHHVEYAKYLANTIAPLVASLDVAFNAREIIRAMGHNFEPDYLLRTLDGQTVWGEYLGMSDEGSSAGTYYNIRSEFKKIGYGTKGVFFYPTNIPRFPNPALLQILQGANVIGFDANESEYYIMVDGRKDYIRTHTTNSSQV